MSTANKLPKGRVMWATNYMHLHNHDTLTPIYHCEIPNMDQIPAAVIPCRSVKQAKQILKLAREMFP